MKSNNDYLNILRNNGGFNPAEKWLNYAKKHNFYEINSTKLKRCPDCNNDNLVKFGQYIYYSNIFHVKLCPNCGLYFSDTLLNGETIAKHFENTYNDELYFAAQRKSIFKYITSIANKHTPKNGKLMDIGGGKGHMLNNIKTDRPDIHVTLNDLSNNSCNHCSEMYAIQTICSNIPDLQKLGLHFNTLLLIDVIYYEPKLNEMFETIKTLLYSNEGTIIIRIPNKLRLIKLYQFLLNTFGTQNRKTFQNNIKHLNPEHIYIFSQPYLKKKLKTIGFNKITFTPSPLLNKTNGKERIFGVIFFHLANILYKLSFGKLILTPSMIVIASK